MTSSWRSPSRVTSPPTTSATSASSSTTSQPCAKRPGAKASAIVADTGKSFDFLDPWGNRFQVVGYGDVQFERTDGVKRKLGIEELEKTPEAQRQISERGLD